MACHVVLEEIGAPFELELISSRGEREGAATATEEWRSINPKGRIPALSAVPGGMGGAPNLLTEAPAILFYLAAAHAEVGLLPKDAAGTARCLEWLNWLGSNVHTMSYGQIWRPHRYTVDDKELDAIRRKGRANLTEQHAYIEKLLGDGRDWAVPGGYSVADAYLLVFYQWGQRIGFAMPEAYPAWTALMDNILARPAVQRVLQKEGVEVRTSVDA